MNEQELEELEAEYSPYDDAGSTRIVALVAEVRRLKAWDLKLSQININFSQENKRLRAALEEIISECPNPKLPYAIRVVETAKEALNGGEQ